MQGTPNETGIGRLEKLVRANRLRRTRLHTERGELLPLRAVPAALASIRSRARSEGKTEAPWIAPSAISVLERILDPSRSEVLELGCGSSTAWLAARARSVVSWEGSPAWADRIRAELKVRGAGNAEVREVAIDDMVNALRELPGSTFDLVVVDCSESAAATRLDCVAAASHLVRPAGHLLLDDSDRRHLWAAAKVLDGWTADRHVGMKPVPLMAVETTLFERPA